MSRTLIHFLLPVLSVPLFSQHRVDSSQMYERVYAILPIVGQGTWEDPKRPMFTPPPSAMTPGDRSGIIAFHHEVSDDGQLALVEIVAADSPRLAAVLAQLQNISHLPGVQIFDREKHGRKDIQKAFKVKKKDFDIDRFRVVVP